MCLPLPEPRWSGSCRSCPDLRQPSPQRGPIVAPSRRRLRRSPRPSRPHRVHRCVDTNSASRQWRLVRAREPAASLPGRSASLPLRSGCSNGRWRWRRQEAVASTSASQRWDRWLGGCGGRCQSRTSQQRNEQQCVPSASCRNSCRGEVGSASFSAPERWCASRAPHICSQVCSDASSGPPNDENV